MLISFIAVYKPIIIYGHFLFNLGITFQSRIIDFNIYLYYELLI